MMLIACSISMVDFDCVRECEYSGATLIGPFAKWTFPRTGPLPEAYTAFWRELAITSSTSSTVKGTFQELDPSAGFAHGGPISVARLYQSFCGWLWQGRSKYLERSVSSPRSPPPHHHLPPLTPRLSPSPWH